MDREKLLDYYIGQDYNCAESLLRTANEEYGLGLDETALKLAAGFGGGMGCGEACGALYSAIAVISSVLVDKRAHATAGFGGKCGAFCRQFGEKLGSLKCSELKAKNMREDVRCFKTVEEAYGLLEAFLVSEGKIKTE